MRTIDIAISAQHILTLKNITLYYEEKWFQLKIRGPLFVSYLFNDAFILGELKFQETQNDE